MRNFEISSTLFIDYCLKAGSPKLTVVNRIIESLVAEYDPRKDYYKKFRDALRQLQKAGETPGTLPGYFNDLPKGKVENYGLLTQGFQKYFGKKKLIWAPTSACSWKSDDLMIGLNPEVGFEVNGEVNLFKLYLKGEKISKDRLGVILAMMNSALPDNDVKLGILDVRRGNAYFYEPKMSEMLPLLEAEASSLGQLLTRKLSI